jgi:hypothetical protein
MGEQITEFQHEPVKGWQMWYTVGAGPVIWAGHLVVAYALQVLGCYWGWLGQNVWGMPALRLALLLVTLAAVAAILFGAFLGLSNWRRVRDERTGGSPEHNRFTFMTYSGIALSLLFATVTGLKIVPILTIGICAR